jgi:mRNA interferase HigB
MRIIARSTLARYWGVHPETEASLQHWLTIAEAANWTKGADVMASFPKASVINAERVRFEIHGGDYRLIVSFKYEAAIAFIKFIGTHAEYDRVNAASISLF